MRVIDELLINHGDAAFPNRQLQEVDVVKRQRALLRLLESGNGP